MKQIKDLSLYVGTKEEYLIAKQKGMKIVFAPAFTLSFHDSESSRKPQDP